MQIESAPAAPAPASPSSAPEVESPAPAPVAVDTRSARQRETDGRFARANSPAKRAIMAQAMAEDRGAPDVADDNLKAVEKTPVDASTVVGEAKQDTPSLAASDDPTSWAPQAQKAHAELTERVTRHESELSQWHEAGPKAVQQNMRLHEENKILRAALESAGGSVDQRDLDLIGYRVNDESVARATEIESARQEHAQEQQTAQIKSKATADAKVFIDDIRSQAKASGVEMKEVAAIVHQNISLRRDPGIAEAIQQVKDLQLLRQRKVNAGAPSTVSRSIPAGTTMPKDRSDAGKLARLRALGHDI